MAFFTPIFYTEFLRTETPVIAPSGYFLDVICCHFSSKKLNFIIFLFTYNFLEYENSLADDKIFLPQT